MAWYCPSGGALIRYLEPLSRMPSMQLSRQLCAFFANSALRILILRHGELRIWVFEAISPETLVSGEKGCPKPQRMHPRRSVYRDTSKHRARCFLLHQGVYDDHQRAVDLPQRRMDA